MTWKWGFPMNANGFDQKSWAFIIASIRLCSEANKMLAKSGTQEEMGLVAKATGNLVEARDLIHSRL